MARKSREEKFLDSTEEVIKDLENLYDENGRAVIEYKKVLSEYKKLLKRFNKTITMNDAIGKSVIVNNESLKGKLTYTIDTAREKLLYNVAEHRKTKEKLSEHLELEKKSSKGLNSNLDLAYKRISELEKEIEQLKIGKSDLSHEFGKSDIKTSKLSINLEEYKKFSYNDLLSREIKKVHENKTTLYLIKLTIDNFERIVDDIEEKGTMTNFLKGNVKFISTTLGNQAIVYYSHHNVFYIIYPKIQIDLLKQKLSKLQVKRRLGDNNITFSMGVVCFIEKDNFDTLNEKADKANAKAALENLEPSVEYNL